MFFCSVGDVHLCHLSLGTEVTWAVDTRGGVYMRQGSLDPPHPSVCPQAWLQVDNVALPAGAVITKVMQPHPLLVHVFLVDHISCIALVGGKLTVVCWGRTICHTIECPLVGFVLRGFPLLVEVLTYF